MTKKPVSNVAASVKQRLINRARADGVDVNLDGALKARRG